MNANLNSTHGWFEDELKLKLIIFPAPICIQYLLNTFICSTFPYLAETDKRKGKKKIIEPSKFLQYYSETVKNSENMATLDRAFKNF